MWTNLHIIHLIGELYYRTTKWELMEHTTSSRHQVKSSQETCANVAGHGTQHAVSGC